MNTSSELVITDFEAFFHALHGHPPYPWQQQMAEDAVEGHWPDAINLPTGSGKTACLDVAVFALACQAARPVDERHAPRRMFFCVNRRVIVDEAHQRAKKIAERLWRAERHDGEPTLQRVAAALREIAGTDTDPDTPPLDVLELRGGIFRDNRWSRSATQPTIVCTTLDQLGSRLLFRGYGVSSAAAPVQAALIAYDSLVLLDEAHISRPFQQTLERVANYLQPQWARQALPMPPMRVIPMTATPAADAARLIELTDADRAVGPLHHRLTASKPTQLRQVKVSKSKGLEGEVVAAVREAVGEGPIAVGVIVNRVATARTVFDALHQLQADGPGKNDKLPEVPSDAALELVIGSMRPLDRDKQTGDLAPLVGSDRPKPHSTQTSIVIATQCLEVGADYDFDLLISECASLDALRQRFGRLNRAGRAIPARGVILAGDRDIKPLDKLDEDKPLDPIYGNALARTWRWLNAHATDGAVDFGIDAFDALLQQHGENGRPPAELLAPAASLDAPVMMPAYVDLWCQTAPQPEPDPDVSLFIHGPQGGEPDVQICWRADLGHTPEHVPEEHWPDAVALLPPTSAECVRLPISRVRQWLTDSQSTSDTGDALGVTPDEDDNRPLIEPHRRGVLWRGIQDSLVIHEPDQLRPGDTLVLPAACPDPLRLAHLPGYTLDASVPDLAEPAYLAARRRHALRLHPAIPQKHEGWDHLMRLAQDEGVTVLELQAGLEAAAGTAEGADAEAFQSLAKGFIREPYPDGRGVVLIARHHALDATSAFLPATDDGEDDASRFSPDQPLTLAEHTQHVTDALTHALARLPLADWHTPLQAAATRHDWGKADERFQAMLRRSDRTDAWLLAGREPPLLAKSAALPRSKHEADIARQRAGLPRGFRHEMLSAQLAEADAALAAEQPHEASDLVLHLIAAHHGHARPFAPVVLDEETPPIQATDIIPALSHDHRHDHPPHRLDSGIPERFWRLTRRFGWWGLAYLEAVLRLADQQASAQEAATPKTAEATA